MRIGYARVSTADQNPDLQEDALQKAACEKIFRDVASGAVDSRRGRAEAIDYDRDGDTLVVWKLDRLGRSLKHLIETVNGLAARKVGFQSLRESMDTTTSGGKLIFHVFGALAEFERELIRERTQARLRAARARGRNGGRAAKMDGRIMSMAQALLENPNASITDFRPRGASYFAEANDETVVIAIIETPKALEDLDAIVATPGLDVAWMGHYYLTVALGIPAQFDHPVFLDLTGRTRCRKHGVARFLPATTAEKAHWLAKGISHRQTWNRRGRVLASTG